MAAGINLVVVGGHVVRGSIKRGTTTQDTRAMSFMLESHSPSRAHKVQARVNLFAGLADLYSDRIEDDAYVQVKGELMNRSSKDHGMLLEVRGVECIFDGDVDAYYDLYPNPLPPPKVQPPAQTPSPRKSLPPARP